MAAKEIGANISVAGLSAMLHSGATDPVAVAETVLANIASYRDRAVFTEVLDQRALGEAAASSVRFRSGRSLGLLDGIPFAWKDLFDTQGAVTTAGSAVLQGSAAADSDAVVVSRLAQAGVISIGRTNLSEFAFSGLGINPTYGTPRNPADKETARIPGGSSSGSAIAVAAGLVPAAMGTDTGGSIRIPAALNGIVGYKATRGRYPMGGVFPLAKSLDSLGPLCRSVQDATWIDAAMRGQGAPAVSASGIAGQRLVVPQTVVFDDAEPEVVAAFEAAILRLERKGAIIERRPFPLFQAIFDLMARYGALVTAEAYALHEQRLSGPDAERMDPRVVARTRLGAKTGLTDYIAILDARERLIRQFSDEIETGALLVYPTLPHVAPPVAPLLDDDDLFFRTNAKTLRNTLIGNFLDGCGVSIPCGTGAAGMPVGLLLSGQRNEDERLLAFALATEQTVRGEA